MMISLSAARLCIAVMKQRSNCLHFWPAQSSERASSLDQTVLDFGQFFQLRTVTGFGGRLPFANDAKLRRSSRPLRMGSRSAS